MSHQPSVSKNVSKNEKQFAYVPVSPARDRQRIVEKKTTNISFIAPIAICVKPYLKNRICRVMIDDLSTWRVMYIRF